MEAVGFEHMTLGFLKLGPLSTAIGADTHVCHEQMHTFWDGNTMIIACLAPLGEYDMQAGSDDSSINTTTTLDNW